MTSAPVDLRQVRQQTSHRPAPASEEALSPARRVLPWALLLLGLSLVATGYAVVLQAGTAVTGGLVLVLAVLGAVAGLSLRDARDRWVPARRAMGDAARSLGRALWH